MASILGNIIAASFCCALQQIKVFRRYNIALLDNRLACWLKENIIFSFLVHSRAQFSQCIAFGLAGSFQILLALGFELHTVLINTIFCTEEVIVAPLF